MKLGAPKMPSRCASSVCARSRALIASDCAAASTGSRLDLQPREDVGDGRRLVDPAAFAELGPEHRAAEILAPAAGEPDQRHPRRQQAVLRKRLGPPERQAQVGAQPLEVAPHVAALGRIEIERRGSPALRLEDRPEQERPKAHRDAGLSASGPIRMAAG